MKIIIVHRGKQDYLKCCINQARKLGNEVVLLGDESNKSVYGWENLQSYESQELNVFRDAYVHMSGNRFNYERICFERYYYVLEYMKKNHIDECIMMDSDILMFCNADNLKLNSFDFGVNVALKDESVSAHFSYWKYDALLAFTNFIIETYKDNISILEEKWKRHVDNNLPGGVCDMTLLMHFVLGTDRKYCDFSSTESISLFGGIIDNQLDEDSFDELSIKMDKKRNIKRLTKMDKGFYCEDANDKKILMLTIHAQGLSKRYMRAFYRNNISAFSMGISEIMFTIEKACSKISRMIFSKQRFN